MSRSRPHVFIAGPHCPDGSGLAAIEDAARELLAAGLEPMRALTAYQRAPEHVPFTWIHLGDWVAECCIELGTCQGVALLDGWRQSPGTMLEVGFALARGLPVLRLRAWLDQSWRDWFDRGQEQGQVIAEILNGDVPRGT